MINIQMKDYDYYTYGANDSYGQPQLSDIKGKVRMTINLMNQAIGENPLYSGAQYIGLTLDNAIDSTYVIQFDEEKLKVLYVNPFGRYKQVFLARM